MRKEVPLVVTFVAGALAALGVYLGFPKSFTQGLDRWYVISVAFAVLVGAINQALAHYRTISRRRKNWEMSIVLLACLAGTVIVGVIDKPSGPTYNRLFQATIVPLGASVFALLAFYISSAAYRAFRMRNLEAGVLLVSACICMLGRAPVGNVIWTGFPAVTSWIMDVPNASAMRGIILGVYIGAFVQAIKVLLGIERSHLGA